MIRAAELFIATVQWAPALKRVGLTVQARGFKSGHHSVPLGKLATPAQTGAGLIPGTQLVKTGKAQQSCGQPSLHVIQLRKKQLSRVAEMRGGAVPAAEVTTAPVSAPLETLKHLLSSAEGTGHHHPVLQPRRTLSLSLDSPLLAPGGKATAATGNEMALDSAIPLGFRSC